MNATAPLPLAFSPCPNDTYLFYAWVHGRVAPDLAVHATLADIETLNAEAKKGQYAVTKLSIAAYPTVWEHYQMLPVGTAVSEIQGPKLVGLPERLPLDMDLNTWLKGKSVAVPGEHTTAFWALRILYGSAFTPVFCRYHEVLQQVKSGRVDAGLLIHETRTHFAHEGVEEVADLGLGWQNRYGCPLPLGGLFIKRALPAETRVRVLQALRDSLEFAKRFPQLVQAYMMSQAQEKDLAVIERHLELYVTDETSSLSQRAQESVLHFFACGHEHGWWPRPPKEWLWIK